MAEKIIYEDDFWYTTLRSVVDRYIKGSFRKWRITGLEKIPTDGAVILSPNHCDALMDPLAVLAMTPGKKVFVARADVFRKPVFRKILTFFKIMPITRVRDGFRNVLDTNDTIEKSIEVLNNRVPFCILPEGTHRSMHSLLPLGKGISRIALGAHRTMPDGAHVYIVPIGCEYGDYYRYRSTLMLTIGDPIDVSAWIEAHPELRDPEMLSAIRTMTAEAMKQQIVWLPDDADYEAMWELAKLQSGQVPECKLQERMQANRDASARLQRLREEKPEQAKALFEKVIRWMEARRGARVALPVTTVRHPLLAALWRTLKGLVTLPFALVYALLSSPAWGVGEKLAAGVEDRTFRNSFRLCALLLVWTLLLIVYAVVLFCTLKWYWALLALVLLLPAPLLAYDWFEQMRRLASAWRWCRNPQLRNLRCELKNEMNETLNNI
jgi:1-acyl-sn-glycerol-3-phosphate acyltransferase